MKDFKIYLNSICNFVCLIATLTTSKFLLLKNPFRFLNLSKKTAHRVCSLVLIAPFSNPIVTLAVDKDDVAFEFKTYACNYGFRVDAWKKIVPIISIVTMLVPNIVILATTIPTLVIARRSASRVGRNVPWQGALAVTLTAVVYCITSLPLFVY